LNVSPPLHHLDRVVAEAEGAKLKYHGSGSDGVEGLKSELGELTTGYYYALLKIRDGKVALVKYDPTEENDEEPAGEEAKELFGVFFSPPSIFRCRCCKFEFSPKFLMLPKGARR